MFTAFPEYINSNTHRTIKFLQQNIRTNNLEEVFTEDGALKDNYCIALDSLKHYHREHVNFLLNSPVISQFGITEENVTNVITKCSEATQQVIDNEYESHSFHRKMLSDILDYSMRGYGYNFLQMSRDNFNISVADYLADESKYEEARKRDTHIQTYINLIEYSISKAVLIDLLLANSAMDFDRAKIDSKKERFRHFFTSMVDAYNWSSSTDLTFNDKEAAGILGAFDTITFNIPIEAFRRIIDADYELDINKLQFQGRKTIICDLEKVSDEEILKAAKKMKFNGDLSSINCYKITSGYKIKDARVFHNYWQLRKLDEQGKKDLFDDISGNYLVVSKTPTSSFQAITTSIGRCLGSVNRKVTTAVMDSFDLGF